jgi:hypothetical protein
MAGEYDFSEASGRNWYVARSCIRILEPRITRSASWSLVGIREFTPPVKGTPQKERD